MSETAGQLVLYGSNMPGQDQKQQTTTDPFDNVDYQNINPQDLGKIINMLQDEIKVIKLQLENLPGYAIGKHIF